MDGRVARRVSWVARQVGHTRHLVRQAGWRGAIAERVGAVVARSPQWRDLDRRFEHEHFVHHHDEHATTTRFDGVHQWLRNTDARHDELVGQIGHVGAGQAAIGERLAGVEQRVGELVDIASAHEARLSDEREGRAAELHGLQRQIDELRAGAQSLNHIVTDWLWAANAPLPSRPLISVVMTSAFPERVDYLRSAIDSVLLQTYSEWELFVVDDSPDGYLRPTPAWWPADPRVHLLRGTGLGHGAARNVGVGASAGDVIAYLDDDCRWFPWWLHAVARAFGTDPDIAIVHGIRLVEADPGGETWSYAQVVDELSLHTTNPADTNVMAHRAGLPDAAWPDLPSCTDYDLVVRIARGGARYLPVPAATYAVSSPSRVWSPERTATNHTDFALVRRRARRARPLRVVAHNSLYPLLTETYIGDELEALRRRDIDVALSRGTRGTVAAPSRIDAPIHESLADAIAAHDPDVVLSHWADVGLGIRAECAAAGVPYTIRLHSFDGNRLADDLIDDWCAGIWGFRHLPRQHPRHFHLDTLLLDPPPFSDAPRERSALSLSAALPKKDFPTLLGALAMRPSVQLRIVLGTTNTYEHVPSEVRALVDQHDVSGKVVEDVSYEEAQAAVRSAGALVYSLAAGSPIGQPRSVLEGAIAGTPLVVPSGVVFDDLLGEIAHRYERGDARSLAAALDDALDRPHSLDARHALAERVAARHGGDATIDEWANSLTAAVVSWQRRSRRDREGANLRWWWQA